MNRFLPALRPIPEGRDIVLAFGELFPDQTGWVLASGLVEDVEISIVSAGPESRRAIRGRFLLTQLSGPLGGPYGVTLSRVDNDRLEVLAGTLLRARAAGVQAMYLPSEGAGLVAPPRPPAPTPVPELEEPAIEPAPAAAPSAWASAANAVVAAIKPPRAVKAEPIDPDVGDLVEHFAFGLCEVISSEGERLVVRDLSRGGRARDIRIDVLQVHPPIERDGKRVFRLSRRS